MSLELQKISQDRVIGKDSQYLKSKPTGEPSIGGTRETIAKKQLKATKSKYVFMCSTCHTVGHRRNVCHSDPNYQKLEKKYGPRTGGNSQAHRKMSNGQQVKGSEDEDYKERLLKKSKILNVHYQHQHQHQHIDIDIYVNHGHYQYLFQYQQQQQQHHNQYYDQHRHRQPQPQSQQQEQQEQQQKQRTIYPNGYLQQAYQRPNQSMNAFFGLVFMAKIFSDHN